MSLIGDALRKARQEAAERDSDRRGILFSAKIAENPTRSNLGLGLALGALIAVVATVAGGFAVWWILSGSGTSELESEAPPTAVAAAEPATAAEIETETAPVPGSAKEGDRGSNNRDIAEGQPPGTESAPVPTTVPVSDGSDNGSNSATHDSPLTPRDPDPEPQVSSSNTGFVGMVDGEEVYIMEAVVGDVRLSLDFLVFREDDPFAEINGVEVHIGGTIAGYRVKSIERDRVRLSNGRRTIVLRAP